MYNIQDIDYLFDRCSHYLARYHNKNLMKKKFFFHLVYIKKSNLNQKFFIISMCFNMIQHFLQLTKYLNCWYPQIKTQFFIL